MLTIAWLLIASAVSLQPDTTVVLGLMERDLLAQIARSFQLNSIGFGSPFPAEQPSDTGMEMRSGRKS